MKIYIAKWPNGTISIVKASSKTDLFWKLDREGDPGSAEVFILPAEKNGAMHISTHLIKINKKQVIQFSNNSEYPPRKTAWP